MEAKRLLGPLSDETIEELGEKTNFIMGIQLRAIKQKKTPNVSWPGAQYAPVNNKHVKRFPQNFQETSKNELRTRHVNRVALWEFKIRISSTGDELKKFRYIITECSTKFCAVSRQFYNAIRRKLSVVEAFSVKIRFVLRDMKI